MDADFWLKRWEEDATGFHLNRVMPLLTKYWATLAVPDAARVLVPLCGKSLDMIWLASQGYQVLGVELAPKAVEQFFNEHGLHPTQHDSLMGRHYVAGNIEIICGDIFDVDAATLSTCRGIYDRAALVALPPDMRSRYVQHVYGNLHDGFGGLLLTLEYDQSLMAGPPFSVPGSEIEAQFAGLAASSKIAEMNIIDKEPMFRERGLNALLSAAWALRRLP